MPTSPRSSGGSSGFCPSCGARSQTQWKFCAGCGEALPRLEDVRPQNPQRRAPKQSDLVAALIEEPVAPVPAGEPGRDAPYDAEQSQPSAPAPTAEPVVAVGDDEAPWESEGVGEAINIGEPALVEEPALADDPEPVGAEEAEPVGADEAALDAEGVGEVLGVDELVPLDEMADIEEVALEALPEQSGPSPAAAFVGGPRQGRDTGYLQFVALVAAALAVAVAAALIVLNRRLSSFTTAADADGVDSADRWVEQVFQPLFFMATVALLVGLAWWTTRRRGELHELNVGSSRFADGPAAASWLIPGVNLVMPVMVLDELWRGGRVVAGHGEWDDQPSNPWLWVWSAIAALGVVIAIGAAVISPSTIEGTIDANTWSGIGYSLIGLALLVLVLTMSAVATTLRMSLRLSEVDEVSNAVQ